MTKTNCVLYVVESETEEKVDDLNVTINEIVDVVSTGNKTSRR